MEYKLIQKEELEVTEPIRNLISVAKGSDDEKEREVYKIINNMQAILPVDKLKAPFKNFSNNDETQWSYISNSEIEEYLKSKFFFNTMKLDFNNNGVSKIFTINKKGDALLKIPLDLITCAAGFKDWSGRDKDVSKAFDSKYSEYYSSSKMLSLNVIKHYASLPSKLPPVEIVNMFVQPDSKVFFDNNAGDSHRIAAAILRGDSEIDAENLVVYRLNKNYI